MGKAFRGAALVHLPQASNNADHGLLLLARRVSSFQLAYRLSRVTNCILTHSPGSSDNALRLFLFSHPLKRAHAMFGLLDCLVQVHGDDGRFSLDADRRPFLENERPDHLVLAVVIEVAHR